MTLGKYIAIVFYLTGKHRVTEKSNLFKHLLKYDHFRKFKY